MCSASMKLPAFLSAIPYLVLTDVIASLPAQNLFQALSHVTPRDERSQDVAQHMRDKVGPSIWERVSSFTVYSIKDLVYNICTSDRFG